MLHKTYHMCGDTKNKEQGTSAMLITSMSEHEEANKLNEELEDSRDNDDVNQRILQKISSLLISIISNQEPLRYGAVMKLGLIPTEYGARSSVLTNSFKAN